MRLSTLCGLHHDMEQLLSVSWYSRETLCFVLLSVFLCSNYSHTSLLSLSLTFPLTSLSLHLSLSSSSLSLSLTVSLSTVFLYLSISMCLSFSGYLSPSIRLSHFLIFISSFTPNFPCFLFSFSFATVLSLKITFYTLFLLILLSVSRRLCFSVSLTLCFP